MSSEIQTKDQIYSQTNYSYNTKNICDIELTVENLIYIIRNRHQLETMEINDIRIMYMDIDKIIKQCCLNLTQREVLNMAMKGYTYMDIAEIKGWYIDKLENNQGQMTSRPNENQARMALRSICNQLYTQQQLNKLRFNMHKNDIKIQ